jgi:hypothetical protein
MAARQTRRFAPLRAVTGDLPARRDALGVAAQRLADAVPPRDEANRIEDAKEFDSV